MDSFKWHEEFTKEQDSVKLFFNDPEQDPEGNAYVIEVHVKKNTTLLELKQVLSEKINLPTNEFILKRHMQTREYKDLKATMAQLGFNSGACIRVVKGKPHEEGVFEVNISLVTLRQSTDYDDILFDKKPLFKLVVNPSISGIEFK